MPVQQAVHECADQRLQGVVLLNALLGRHQDVAELMGAYLSDEVGSGVAMSLDGGAE